MHLLPSTGIRLVALAALTFVVPAARAATVTWENPVSGDWTDASKWSGGVVPTALDDVAIDKAGTYTVVIVNLRELQIRSLTLGGTTGVQTLHSITLPFQITGPSSIGDNGHLQMFNTTISGGGSLVNRGRIDLAGSQILIALDHYGTVQAHSSASLIGATGITSRPGSTIWIGSDIWSTNASLSINALFTNHGRIVFDSDKHTSSGDRLVLNNAINAADGIIETAPGDAGMPEIAGLADNQGLIRLASPLKLSIFGTPAFNHGSIQVLAGNVEFAIRSDPTFARSFSNTGTIEVAAGSFVSSQGGTFNYDPGTVTGPGRMRFLNVGVHEMTLGPGSATAVLEGGVLADHVVNGGTLLAVKEGNQITNFETLLGSMTRVLDSGAIGPTQLTVRNNFTNHGAIEIDPPAGSAYSKLLMLVGQMTNATDGTVRGLAGPGGGRIVQGRIVNYGTFVAVGDLELRGGPVQHTEGGSVEGAGKFTVSGAGYVDNGNTNPGPTAAILSFVGDNVRSATSSLDIEVGGLAVGTQHDRLAVSGAFECGGALRLQLIDGFVPTLGDRFTIVTAAAVTGVFNVVTGQLLPGGLAFRVNYGPDHVELLVVEASTPAYVRLFDAAAGEGGVTLRWQLEDRASLVDLRVERSDAATGPWTERAIPIVADGAFETAFDEEVQASRSYWYRLAARRSDGAALIFGPVEVNAAGSVVAFALAPVVPNPARGRATLRFALPVAGAVRLAIHDVRGRLVGVPVSGTLGPGWHAVAWGGKGVVPGIYLVTMTAPGHRLTQRVTVVR